MFRRVQTQRFALLSKYKSKYWPLAARTKGLVVLAVSGCVPFLLFNPYYNSKIRHGLNRYQGGTLSKESNASSQFSVERYIDAFHQLLRDEIQDPTRKHIWDITDGL
jgi:hypothetical protein